MAIWELIVDALSSAHSEGQEWLGAGEIIDAGSVRGRPRLRFFVFPTTAPSTLLIHRNDRVVLGFRLAPATFS